MNERFSTDNGIALRAVFKDDSQCTAASILNVANIENSDERFMKISQHRKKSIHCQCEQAAVMVEWWRSGHDVAVISDNVVVSNSSAVIQGVSLGLS